MRRVTSTYARAIASSCSSVSSFVRPCTSAVASPLHSSYSLRIAAPFSLYNTPKRSFAGFTSFDEDDSKPKPAVDVYNHSTTGGSVFRSPRTPRDRNAVHGIGLPSQAVVDGKQPRRYVRPRGVQGIKQAVKTYTEGPRELGHPVIRSFIGKVTSDKMDKTIAVEVAQYYKHPKYRKYIKTSKKFLAHDQDEECNIGDIVEIRVSRPFSKRKHFTLHRVVKPKLPIDHAAELFVQHNPKFQTKDAAESK